MYLIRAKSWNRENYMQKGTGGQFGFRMVKIQGQEKVIKMTPNVISLTLTTSL